MARIYIYTDLSPSRAWIFASIHANQNLLAAHGIDLGPFSPWSCEIIPSHTPYWYLVPEGKAIPKWMAKQMEELRYQLDAGRDVLLMSYTPNMLCHRSLERLIRKYLDLHKHDVRLLFAVGRPLCVLEQRYREVGKPPAERVVEQLVGWYKRLSSLIMDAQNQWGSDNVGMLPDLSDSPTAAPNMELAKQVFTWLGCPEPRFPERLPRHPLFLQSHSARRLNWALEVRDNAWPGIDGATFISVLASLDKKWDTAPISPLKTRYTLLQNARPSLKILEALLGVDSGALDGPEWLLTQTEEAFDSALAEDKLILFVEALPSEVSTALAQRYANDAHLLTQDQQALAHVLSLSSSKQNINIEEQEFPVVLTVLTMTYNHEKYIAECMESVLAQKTSFPVQHIVLDHHSTDRTPEIISAYAEKYPSIRPVLLSCRRHKENVTGLFSRCRTKYAALCDGDDYFTDPLKLQKQVDFLENNLRCALCFHSVSVEFEDGEQKNFTYPPQSLLPRGVRKEYYLADLFQGNFIQTNSVVYRWRFQDGLPKWFRPDLCPGDWYWHLLHAEKGKIGFLPEVMSVYRRHKNAVYSHAFISKVDHRRDNGMQELETYHVVNEHFEGRYFIRLAGFANGVFADFFKISTEEDDDSLINQACEKYPYFANHFLQSLKIVNMERSASCKV